MINDNRGVTLLELLIVLSILTILSTIAILNYNSILASQKLHIVAKEMVSNLREGQQLAISRETNVQASFFRNLQPTDIYTIRVLEGGTYQSYKAISLPNDIKIAEANFGFNQIRFAYSIYGKPNLNGHIRLVNNRGQNLFVVVYQTGRIRITSRAP